MASLQERALVIISQVGGGEEIRLFD